MIILKTWFIHRMILLKNVKKYNGHLFLLSDEAACVWKMDLATNKILKTYTFNILNAEGLCFEADGGMWILSDAEQKIYQFEKRQW